MHGIIIVLYIFSYDNIILGNANVTEGHMKTLFLHMTSLFFIYICI